MSTRKKKPYALKAADDLDGMWLHSHAAELRRLHEVNAELLGTLKEIGEFASEQWVSNAARAAIAKAEEVKP